MNQYNEHYKYGKYDVKDLAMDWILSWELFNILKYTVRIHKKNQATADMYKIWQYYDYYEKNTKTYMVFPQFSSMIRLEDILEDWKDLSYPQLEVLKIIHSISKYGKNESLLKQLKSGLILLEVDVEANKRRILGEKTSSTWPIRNWLNNLLNDIRHFLEY